METLRLHPVSPAVLRTVSNSFEFAGHTVPAGRLVMIGTAVGHGLEEHFPQPECFDIDRYTRARSEHRQRGAYAPFGAGSHRCLGSGLVPVQIGLTITTILHELVLRPLHARQRAAGEVIPDDAARRFQGPCPPSPVRSQRLGYELEWCENEPTFRPRLTIAAVPFARPVAGGRDDARSGPALGDELRTRRFRGVALPGRACRHPRSLVDRLYPGSPVADFLRNCGFLRGISWSKPAVSGPFCGSDGVGSGCRSWWLGPVLAVTMYFVVPFASRFSTVPPTHAYNLEQITSSDALRYMFLHLWFLYHLMILCVVAGALSVLAHRIPADIRARMLDLLARLVHRGGIGVLALLAGVLLYPDAVVGN